VRLPVDEKELWNEDGTKNEAAFRMLKEGIDWCRAEHLRVIVDLHTTRSHHFNAAESGGHNTLFTDPAALKHFISLWDDLMSAIGDVPNSELAYEIMNEPTAENPEDWNRLVATAMKAIRAKEPNRVIVIGANMWQIPQSFPYLKVPEGDKNIILSFHTYEPLFFTHHTANWVLGPIQDYKGPVNYPGPIIDKATYDKLSAESAAKIKHPLETSVLDNWGPDRIRKEIEPAIIRAKELNLQLFCGEFGCLPTVPREARLAYYRDIVGVFESAGIAWCNWEYKGDFGIYEWHGEKYLTGAPDLEMIGALLGTKCPAKACPAPACPMKK
jgi:endoglucanase